MKVEDFARFLRHPILEAEGDYAYLAIFFLNLISDLSYKALKNE